MSIASLQIIENGLHTSLQDSGRRGVAQWGIPASGAMDQYSMSMANWLLGNPLEQAVIEFSLKGGKLQFMQDCHFALTGAFNEAKLDGEAIKMYQTQQATKGATLELPLCQKGHFSYLAVAGKWNLNQQLGSLSTYSPAQLGGINGGLLQKGDTLSWTKTKEPVPMRSIAAHLIPQFEFGQSIIRALKGPEFADLLPEVQEQFSKIPITISPACNRMGYKCTAEALKAHTYDIKSSATLSGTVQLSGEGQLIALMRDAQTTGGYPRIAQIIAVDIDRLAQMRPGSQFILRWVSMKEADAALQYQENIFCN